MDDIIYLEPDEEITSVIDKIKNASSANLGLVIPREATILQSVVNLRLISREANSLNKKISIVTADKIGRNLAAQIGLPVFSSVEEQKPIYSPPAPEISNDEVLEVNSPEEATDLDADNPPGVKVQHYQNNAPQENPVQWRRHEKPVLKDSAGGNHFGHVSAPRMGAPVKNILAKKNTDFKKLHKILWPVLAVFVVLSGVATYLLLPKAIVTISIPSEDLKKSLVLSVSNKATQPNLEQNVFPGVLVESNGEKKDKFSTTGKKDIGTKAKGTITISNNLDSNAHQFPAATQVLSSGKTFLTLAAVSVPGAAVQNGSVVAGTVKVEIEAENPGSDYNVKAGRFTILSLSAAQQSGIYGQSSTDISGGESRQVQVVSQEDYDKAKTSLINSLTDSVAKDLQTKLEGKKIIEKALVTPDPDITSTAKVNQEAANFEMTVKLKNQAMVFDAEELQAFLVKIMEKQVPAEKMVTIASEEDLSLTVDKTSYDNGQMDITANVLAKISDKVSTDKIKQAILGKKKADAETIVKNESGMEKFEIVFTPSWWIKKIPDLERNVTVKTEYLNTKPQE